LHSPLVYSTSACFALCRVDPETLFDASRPDDSAATQTADAQRSTTTSPCSLCVRMPIATLRTRIRQSASSATRFLAARPDRVPETLETPPDARELRPNRLPRQPLPQSTPHRSPVCCVRRPTAQSSRTPNYPTTGTADGQPRATVPGILERHGLCPTNQQTANRCNIHRPARTTPQHNKGGFAKRWYQRASCGGT
jgi:hypothetical protein